MHLRFRLIVLVASLLSVLCVPGALADVAVPPIIGSGMVLQRGMPVPIWGTAAAGEKVTVSFRGQSKSVEADKVGKWSVKLDALDLGDPGTLTVEGKNKLTFTDVLVGDVWVGSGQSNMAMAVASYVGGDKVLADLAAQEYPQVRLATAKGNWRVATPKNSASFSAMLFSFGIPLHKEIKVPVGLIVGAVGGTPSGRWLTREMLFADEPARKAAGLTSVTGEVAIDTQADQKKAAAAYEEAMKKYKASLAAWEASTRPSEGQPAATAPTTRPAAPVPPAKPGPVNLAVGDLYAANIAPIVPFAIRGVLWDQGESGTKIARVDQYTLMGALIKGWRTAWGQGEFPFIYIQKPSGGGCALDPADPVTRGGEKFISLPANVPNPAEGNDRDLHIRIMRHPNTAMVISTDLGPGTHPTNKSGYGARAARVALGFAYGQKIEYYGPTYAGHKIEGDKVRVSFTHVGQGLVVGRGEKLQGFALAGKDGAYHWADATIDGESVVLHSDKVSEPVSIAYASAKVITWANLFNKDGLPAIPFMSKGK